MPAIVYVLRALSPRDGGWVRLGGNHCSEKRAWKFVEVMWPLLVLHEDYVTIEVVRTITFKKIRRRNYNHIEDGIALQRIDE